jgi:hypothetical protein
LSDNSAHRRRRSKPEVPTNPVDIPVNTVGSRPDGGTLGVRSAPVASLLGSKLTAAPLPDGEPRHSCREQDLNRAVPLPPIPFNNHQLQWIHRTNLLLTIRQTAVWH